MQKIIPHPPLSVDDDSQIHDSRAEFLNDKFVDIISKVGG